MIGKWLHWVDVGKHKAWVFWYMLCACRALFHRAVIHDFSKFGAGESPYFERALPRLRGLRYGTDEYRAVLQELGPGLQHHYAVNTHHPEHYKGDVTNMSPLDQIEMLCDHRAAGRRFVGASMANSMHINAGRFRGWRQAEFERDAKEIGLL